MAYGEKMALNLIEDVLWAVYFVATLLCAIMSSLTIADLRNRAPDLYERLGSPSIFFTTPRSSIFIGFILTRKFRLESMDLALTRRCHWLAIITYVQLTAFVALAFLQWRS